ncbi:MAG: 50S ribosomal protein L11 methyltransferase [Anaerolineales bacterium]
MDNDQWLEVSLWIDGELAEAVSEVLSRFAPNGVAIEAEVKGFTPDGQGIPSGMMKVCAYLPIDAHINQTKEELEQALWYLGRIQPIPEAQYRYIQESDWAEAWKEHYHPIPIGKKMIIVPAWLENPQPERIAIRMDPGMAFGTGTHPSTQLCLEAIEDYFIQNSNNEHPNCRMIDVGCGSGILSIAAIKFGAQKALAVDTDSLAIRATIENAQSNGVAEQIECGLGSVKEILSGSFSFHQAELVVANILAPIILSLIDQGLTRLVKLGGVLILAGILDTQSEEIEKTLKIYGFHNIHKKQSADWVALIASAN